MAALSSVHLGNVQKLLISFVYRRFILPTNYRTISRYSTESEENVYTEKNEEELAQIEKKRNKSRMPDHFRILMEEHQQLPEIRFDYQLTTRYKRMMYAKFGRASGIEPSIMWPTKQELKEMIEHEKEFHPSLEEMIEVTSQRRKSQEEAIKKREESVEYNMSKLNKWLEELKQRRDKKLAVIQAQKDKKEQLIEEVRQYFGYRLSPKDPKFIEILEKKEKEEKKQAREAKKQEKFSREMAKLASMAQAGTDKPTAVENPPKKTRKASTTKPSEAND